MISNESDFYASRIKERVPQYAILCQVAEECCEAAQAALKLVRIMDGVNPTPISLENAQMRLVEEIADINVCLKCMDWHEYPFDAMPKFMKQKLKRWNERLDSMSES